MSTQTESQTLMASCIECGANVPIALAGPEPGCPSCDTADPLEPKIRARVQTMRAQLENRASKQRELTGRLIDDASTMSEMSFMVLVSMWLLMGGMALGFAYYTSEEIGLLALAEGPPPRLDLAGPWWALFSLALCLPLAIGWRAATLYRLRGLVSDALPMEPAYPGSPPRCRNCGGDLPEGAALRRCRYCSSNTIVAGECYSRSQRDLNRALDGIASRFERTLDIRLRSIQRSMIFSGLAPVIPLIVGPIFGLLTGVVAPMLWPLTGASVLFAMVAMLLLRSRQLPRIEPLCCLSLGTKLRVGGISTLKVTGQMFIPVQGEPQRVYSILGSGKDFDELILYVKPEPGPDWKTVHELKAGGEPLNAADMDRLEQVQLWVPGEGEDGEVRVEQVHLLSRGKSSLRVWRGERPDIGQAPIWTASRIKDPPMVFFHVD
jgi:hypothetical protein